MMNQPGLRDSRRPRHAERVGGRGACASGDRLCERPWHRNDCERCYRDGGDPVLRQTADAIQQSSDVSAGKGKADAMPMNDVMRIDEIPEDTQCRKVTTQMETKSGGKKSESKDDSKSTNVSILCQMGADWKPASA